MKGWTTGWPERVPAYIYYVPGVGIRTNIGVFVLMSLASKVRAASSILRKR